MKRQPNQPLPGERGREKGGKPEMGKREHSGHHQGGGPGTSVPSGPRGSSVE